MSEGNYYRILVIDDNPAIHEDFRKVFSNSISASAAELLKKEAVLFGDAAAPTAVKQSEDIFEVDTALQGEQGLAMLLQAKAERRPYSVAFVDMRMPPGWNGIKTIKELWKADETLQVVICSAYSDYSPDEISRELGVSNHLMLLRKPFDSLEVRQLATTMSSKWMVSRRRGELERMVERRIPELKRLAMHDSLTGLPNRSLFNERLKDCLDGVSLDSRLKCAVLFIDVDQFKAVNDTLGHEAGDQILIKVAERLRLSVREVDTICCLSRESPADQSSMAARLGGDEFAILLDGIHQDEDAVTVAARLLVRFTEPLQITGREVLSSISIGIATSSGGCCDAVVLLRNADTAMYQAKRDGRARYAVFNERMERADACP